MYECYDDNFFATEFHREMFENVFMDEGLDFFPKSKIVGWPMEYLATSLEQYKGMDKKDIILFPHRIAPEKQVDIFRNLKDSLPQYEFIVCQDQELSKNEYHNLLGQAKLVFSANLQETLGISWYEGALVGAIPMVPDRLSYKEMAIEEFKYPSDWTTDFNSYKKNKNLIIDKIDDYMVNYKKYLPALVKQVELLKTQFFSGHALYKEIKNG